MSDYFKELRKYIGHSPIIIPHSAVILFNKDNKVLIEIRSDDGFYDFPGGGVDLNETVEEAAKRELFEETGLIADKLELFKVYSGPITYYKYANGDEIYGIDTIYICKEYHGELKPQKEEVTSLMFLNLDDLPNGKLSIRNKQIIKDLRENDHDK